MAIKIDADALAQEIQEKKKQLLPPDRDRALTELANVLNTHLSMEKWYGYTQVLAEKHAFVRDHLADIRVEEVLEAAEVQQDGVSVAVRTGSTPIRKRNRKRSDQTDAAIEALKAFLLSTKDKLGKTDIIAGVIDQNPKIQPKALSTAWNAIRNELKDQGKGPTKKYWIPKP